MKRSVFMMLSVIIGSSFLFKLFMIDHELIGDGQTYYNMSLAWASSNNFFIEKSIYIHNLGFPLLHGFIFKIIDASLTLHIVLTIVYSCVSLLFAYLFFRKFVSANYAIFGIVLLAFNSRLMQNASFGITEPLFLLLVWGAIYFSTIHSRIGIMAIPLALLSILVRFEGIVVLGFVIWQYISYKKYHYTIIAAMMILPFYFTSLFGIKKIESVQYESNTLGIIESHLRHEINYISSLDLNLFLIKVANGIVYLGWSLFPEFLLLVPFGLYGIIKKVIGKSVIFWLVVFCAIGVYAYTDAHDTRYFFLSYLFFDLFCIIGLKRFVYDFKKSEIFATIRNKSLMLCRLDKKR